VLHDLWWSVHRGWSITKNQLLRTCRVLAVWWVSSWDRLSPPAEGSVLSCDTGSSTLLLPLFKILPQRVITRQ
jgi:hypothetical protein